MFLPRALLGAILLLSIGCTPGGTDTFVREEQPLAINFASLTGSARTDLWSIAKVNDADTVVHSKGGTRWDALMLTEFAGLRISSIASVAKNEAWVSTTNNISGAVGLWLVAANGGVEDHSMELPVANREQLELVSSGGTLFALQTGTSVNPLGHMYRRTASALEEITGLQPAVQLTVLAAKGPNDFYFDLSPSNFGTSKIMHYLNGAATEIPWPSRNNGLPTIQISSTGEVWFWKSSGSQDTMTGTHGDGSTFTDWSSTWPALTAQQQVQHRVAGAYASGTGKLAFLDVRTDNAIKKETERSSLGVNHIDAQGKYTEGPRLLQCISAEECAIGQGSFVVLGDGVVLINAGGAGKIWFTGPLTSLQ